MENNKLRKEIKKALRLLTLNDRDLRTIAIFCNPNNFHHVKSLGGFPNKEILDELKGMEKEGLVYSQTKLLPRSTVGHNMKKYILWTLK